MRAREEKRSVLGWNKSFNSYHLPTYIALHLGTVDKYVSGYGGKDAGRLIQQKKRCGREARRRIQQKEMPHRNNKGKRRIRIESRYAGRRRTGDSIDAREKVQEYWAVEDFNGVLLRRNDKRTSPMA